MNVTTILTSAVGLGIYIPALLIQQRLRAMGQAADVEVLEEHFLAARLQAHIEHRKLHHENFALARLANRMARDVQDCLDETRIQALLARWKRERRSRFIVWSGFWLPLVERYRTLAPELSLAVDHCRIDAAVSASFRVFPRLRGSGREIWLWNADQERVVHEIPVADAAPLPFTGREKRVVVHGGGWGIGNYREGLDDFAKAGYRIDLVVHDAGETAGRRPGDRCFMMDPKWEPWRREANGDFAFPPMVELCGSEVRHAAAGDPYHALHDVIREAVAVVSKPGGCTLIDSLAAATPVVFLDAYSEAEQCNAQVWQNLGYGISLAAWRDRGYSFAVLEGLHRNIASRRSAPYYPSAQEKRQVQAA